MKFEADIVVAAIFMMRMCFTGAQCLNDVIPRSRCEPSYIIGDDDGFRTFSHEIYSPIKLTLDSSSEVVALRSAHQGFWTFGFYNNRQRMNSTESRAEVTRRFKRLFFSARRQKCRFTVGDVFQYRFASQKFVLFWLKKMAFCL